MKLAKEFKQFVARGNVVDMAVGIIIGGAFGKIISSLVTDLLMPPLGVLIGGVDFTDLKVTLKPSSITEMGDKVQAVTLNYGNFIQTFIDFLIIGFAIFIMIKAMNRMKRKEEEKPAAPPAPSKEEILLSEIRDLLKKQ
jgi:large conductance mechanosensitive channel